MSIPLRILIIEDSEDDTLLLLRELQRGGYDGTHERVETPEAMKAALAEQRWDIILADYTMPHFSAPEALTLLKETELDIPFVIVSGSIGEDIAVAAMKAGAHDYLMKDNLKRLVPAVERELREANIRRERKRAGEALRESEERYRDLLEMSPDSVVVHSEGKIILVNLAGVELLGATNSEQLIGRRIMDFVHPDFREIVRRRVYQEVGQGRETPFFEQKLIRLDGIAIDVEVAIAPFIHRGKKGAQIVARDITERKQAEAERERLIHELREALAKVKTLSGLIPICATCKKIRDDQGYWDQIEAYISKHSEAEFSHGMCPECRKKEEQKYRLVEE